MTDQTDPGPLLHSLTTVALLVHIAGGAIGLVSGTIAVIARKGRRLHRRAGTVFVGSMIVMATFAIYLGFVLPGQTLNVFIGAFALYLVTTAWVTVRRREFYSEVIDKVSLVVALGLCAPFALLTFQLMTGLPTSLTGAMVFKGPIVVAVYSFTAILALTVIGDARVVFGGPFSGAPRLCRHLWRMCLGLSLAAGSGFTNGLARLLPGPYHVPTSFFVPTFVPVGLLIFWLIRVRITRWRFQTALWAVATMVAAAFTGNVFAQDVPARSNWGTERRASPISVTLSWIECRCRSRYF